MRAILESSCAIRSSCNTFLYSIGITLMNWAAYVLQLSSMRCANGLPVWRRCAVMRLCSSCMSAVSSSASVSSTIKAGKEETVKSDAFKALAKDLTLHIAAAAPKSVSSDSLDPAFVAEEQEIAKQQLIQEGKPEHLLEKILPGKLKALYAQSCLLNQVFVKDPAGKMTVEALLNQAGKELGDDISVASFVRYQLGA